MGSYPCQNTTERTRKRSRTEEEGHSIMLLVPLIPHREVEYDAREETALCDTEEESCDQKASEIVGDTHQCGDNAPGDRQCR